VIRLVLLAVLLSTGALAAPAPSERYAVQGVAADDVLNLRAAPSAEARKVGELPARARGVEAIRCVEPESGGRWCRVRHDGEEGWANARFLAAEPPRGAAGAAAPSPLYSVSPKGSESQRSFLVSSSPLGPDRYEVRTRHIVVKGRGQDTIEDSKAVVHCGRNPGVEAMGGRIDLSITAARGFKPPAAERDAQNLWWAVCRGENQRYG